MDFWYDKKRNLVSQLMTTKLISFNVNFILLSILEGSKKDGVISSSYSAALW